MKSPLDEFFSTRITVVTTKKNLARDLNLDEINNIKIIDLWERDKIQREKEKKYKGPVGGGFPPLSFLTENIINYLVVGISGGLVKDLIYEPLKKIIKRVHNRLKSTVNENETFSVSALVNEKILVFNFFFRPAGELNTALKEMGKVITWMYKERTPFIIGQTSFPITFVFNEEFKKWELEVK